MLSIITLFVNKINKIFIITNEIIDQLDITIGKVLPFSKKIISHSNKFATAEYINKLSERDGKTRTWMIGDTLSAGIGQSYNSFTPLQMARYIAMLANGGKAIDVSIVKDIIDVNGESIGKEQVQNYAKDKLNLTETNNEDLNMWCTMCGYKFEKNQEDTEKAYDHSDHVLCVCGHRAQQQQCCEQLFECLVHGALCFDYRKYTDKRARNNKFT